MTDDPPKFCAGHRWTKPEPRLVINEAGELVEHPTLRMKFCQHCPAEESVEPKEQRK